jgi:hypothetical protein
MTALANAGVHESLRLRLTELPEAIRYQEKGHARGKVVITAQ